MNGNNLKFLRKNAGMSQDELSKLLDITLRTLISWEGSKDNDEKLKEDRKDNGEKAKLGKPYVLALRVIFESKLLKSKLREIAEKSYKIAPSRYISIWLVCSHELMLMRDVALHANFQVENKFTNDETRKSIRENSLFTYPIKNNEIINEVKKNIHKHPGKGKAEKDTHYFKDCVFEKNILLIPLFCETDTDVIKRPTALLVLEDKNQDNKVYTEDDINKLEVLLENKYNAGIGEICKALDYYSPLYCDYKIN